MKKILSGAMLFMAVLAAMTVPVFAVDQSASDVSDTYADALTQCETFRFPGEFETHQAIWMAWPTFRYTEEYPSEPVIIKMLWALTPHVHVNLLVPSKTAKNYVQNTLAKNNLPMDGISFYVIPYADIWLRDMGPVYIVGSKGTKKIVDFKFNGWGLPQYFIPEDLAVDEQLDRSIAAEQGLGVISTNVISEGGNREFNGRGTMIAIEETELGRNPGYTKAQLEAEYKRLLGIKKVIWLKRGVVEDSAPTTGLLPGPDGTLSAYAVGVEHVDEVARFASPNVILLAEVTWAEAQSSPIAAENRARLEESYKILRKATDQNGRPFTIIRVPSAKIMYYTITAQDLMYNWLSIMEFDDGSVFPYPEPVNMIAATGYMNFVVTNGVVLVPKYWKLGMPDAIRQKDKQAIQVLQKAFPTRQIVAIDAFAINLGGGGMHCITQQEPVAS